MKKKIFIILLISVLLIATMSVFATASSLSVILKSNPTEVKPGDEVKVTLSLSNIDKGDKEGCNGITGTISYDTNVLTYVKNEAVGNWSVNGFNNLTFAITNGYEYTATNQDVITFTFKVKDNVTATSTEVKVTDIETSFGTASDVTNAQTVTTSDATVTVKINKGSSDSPVITPAQKPSTESTPTTPSVVNPDTSTKSIPQTGISDVIIPIIMVLGAVSVVSYIRYRKYKNI